MDGKKVYLLSLLASSKELRYTRLSRYALHLKDLEHRLESDPSAKLRLVLIKTIRQLTRCFALSNLLLHLVVSPTLSLTSPRFHKTDRFYYSRRNLTRLASSLSVLLSVKPLIKQIFSGSRYSSCISNFLTATATFAIYPNHPIYQKHYMSIYFSVLCLELWYKLLEQLKQPQKWHINGGKWLNSWYIFPLCFSQIYKNYVLNPQSCPRGFAKLLETLGSGFFTSSFDRTILSARPTRINVARFPVKFIALLKYAFPVVTIMTYRDRTTESVSQIVRTSLTKSVKLVSLSLGLGFSSFYLTRSKLLSQLPPNTRLQLVGFLTGCITALFANQGSTTNRSVWLYVLRLTWTSSTERYSTDSRSKFHLLQIDKILLALSTCGILTLNDFYAKHRELDNVVTESRKVHQLAQMINCGDSLLR